MKLYTVHDNKLNITKLFNSHDFSGFLMHVSSEHNRNSSEIQLAVDEYGPQLIANRYLLTLHTV